ncbi:MAG: hypothetical protein ACRDGA_04305 [Bacteroidota bacterium]
MILIVSCEKDPSDDSHLDRLAQSYSSLLMLHEESKSQPLTISPEQYQRRIDSLLAQNGFTHESFRSSLQRLSGEPAALRSFSQKLAELVAPQRNNF